MNLNGISENEPLKDLPGGPIKQLVSIIRDTVGILIDPAHKLTMAAADRRIRRKNADLERENALKDITHKLQAENLDLVERTKLRLLMTEALRQANLEDITVEASFSLPETSTPDNLNKDWLNHFISCAQDTDEEKLRDIWARVLSTECQVQESFSKMTLQKLQSMSLKDCRMFEDLCRRVVDIDGYSVILKVSEKMQKEFSRSYNYNYFSHLCDLGLINNSEIVFFNLVPSAILEVRSKNGDCFFISNEKDSAYKLNFYLLTTAGKELSKLNRLPLDSIYLLNLKETL